MSTYTHENITLNVSTINPRYIEFTGETVLTVPSNLMAELIENSCAFAEFYLVNENDVINEEFDNDLEAIAKYYNELNEDIEVSNPDAIIAVYEYCLGYPNKEFNLDVTTENISWVIHDILHAIHDTAGCTIYVESEIEKQRILTSLDITKTQFPNELPDAKFLENLEAEFNQRFNQYLDLNEFKYLDEIEEYSY